MLQTILESTPASASLQSDQLVFRNMIQSLPAAIYTCDATGVITFYNKAAEQLWGRTPIIGKDVWCGSWKIFTIEGKPVPLDTCPMAVALKEKRPVYGEEIIVERPDGSRHNICPHPQPIFNADGEMIGAMNMLVDITPQRKDQQALRESEERFRNIADTAPVMIWMSDENKYCNFFNRSWCDFTGRPIVEHLGQGWMKRIHPEDVEKCLQVFNTSFDSRKEFLKEHRLEDKNGNYRWVACKGIPRYSASGNFLGYSGTCTDIHDRKLVTEEMERKVKERTIKLRAKNEELKRSNDELASFSYIASHDLQEPLRKITTFSDKLRMQFSNDIPVEGKEYLERIINSSSRMKQLIEDVLNFSRVSSLGEQFVSTDLNDVLKNVLADFDQRILEKKAIVKIEKMPVISAIPLQMRQLFYNLLSNGLKFSSATSAPIIHITSRILSREEVKKFSHLKKRNAYCQITVKDNGIGFPQEFAEKIFTIFQRLHGRSEYSGTGIGLALCRKITDNHKGVIYAQSNEKQGTEFYIVLPVNSH